MWSIQLNWNGTWVTVDAGFATRDAAEWAAGKWKQAHNCTGDPFRAVETPTTPRTFNPNLGAQLPQPAGVS